MKFSIKRNLLIHLLHFAAIRFIGEKDKLKRNTKKTDYFSFCCTQSYVWASIPIVASSAINTIVVKYSKNNFY